MRAKKILCFCLFFLVIYSYALFAASDFNSSLEAADLFLKEGKNRFASEIYLSLLADESFKQNSCYASALYCVALNEENVTTSIKFLTKYIDSVKDRYGKNSLCWLLALEYELIGNFEEALSCYKIIIDNFCLKVSQPESRYCYTLLPNINKETLFYRCGVVASEIGENESALFYLNKILEIQEKSSYSASALMLKSRILLTLGEIEEAIIVASKLGDYKLEIIPPVAHYWINFLLSNYSIQSKDKLSSLDAKLKQSKVKLSAKQVPTIAMILSELKNANIEKLSLLENESAKPSTSNSDQTQKSASTVENSSATQKNYLIQVASFSDEENAIFYSKELAKKGFKYKITKSNKGVFRVYVVPSSSDKIDKLMLQLKTDGYEGFLVEQK